MKPQKPWTVQYGLLWENHHSSCKRCHWHKHGRGNDRMPESSTSQLPPDKVLENCTVIQIMARVHEKGTFKALEFWHRPRERGDYQCFDSPHLKVTQCNNCKVCVQNSSPWVYAHRSAGPMHRVGTAFASACNVSGSECANAGLELRWIEWESWNR